MTAYLSLVKILIVAGHPSPQLQNWGSEVEPVPEKQDTYKQETVEQRVGCQKLAGNRRVAFEVNASLAVVAEYHAQHDRQYHEVVNDTPNRAV